LPDSLKHQAGISLEGDLKMDNRPEDIAAREAARREEAQFERDVALNAAANESLKADIADAQAVDARIRANEANAMASEMATDRNIMSNQLAYERAAASNNAFGFYLTLGILVAGLLVTGIYLYWRDSSDNVNIYAASTPAAVAPAPQPHAPVVVTQPAPTVVTPPPVIVNPNPPVDNTSKPPIVVNPPAVHNDIHVTPPATDNTDNTNTDKGSSSTSSGD
jgi:hypothetical protein